MIADSHQPLPQFEKPPLTEVVLDVQFERIESLLIPEIGALWHHFKDRFASVEQHPPVDPAIERFGIPPGIQLPSIEFVQAPRIPRIWFIDKGQRDLIQVQQDRFIRNWRRISDADQYPRYIDHVRPHFEKDFQDFTGFLAEQEIGQVSPVQCEVTYINHILPCDTWSAYKDVGRVFNFWRDAEEAVTDLALEEVRASFVYLIKYEGENVGRLRVLVEPALRASDRMPIFILRLTARGKPLGSGVAGVLKFFDLGREKIVRTFSAITTSAMHKEWRRQDVE